MIEERQWQWQWQWQTFKWAAAFSLSVNTPVDSTTISAPYSPQGISSGFLQIVQMAFTRIIRQHILTIAFIYHREFRKVPDTKDSDGLLAKEKSLRVLNLDIMMLPLTVNCIILEHVGLPHTKHTRENQKNPLINTQKMKITPRITISL